ncbi:hypothetical protein LTR93_004067 [Exophiala xenobiotica]|nr:hypothetical protein LTR93_004067 [Exophiala xenobiotica]
MGADLSLPSCIAPAILMAFVSWDCYEHLLSERNKTRYRAFPLPKPHEWHHRPSDVSVIIPTVGHDEGFEACICSILTNNPREIIIVTTEAEKARVAELVGANRIESLRNRTEIDILTVSAANKRDQIIRGVNASKGSILALVDDDAYWPHETVLEHLLSPFQQEDVGLAGGAVFSYLPEERKCPDLITPWEVAAIRLRSKRHDSMKSAHAADGGINFCVSGVTMLLRAEILRDPAFQHAFTTDYWMGIRQNTGDDGFLTRWVLFHHVLHPPAQDKNGTTARPRQWRLGIQLTPEAEVGTTIMRDSRFAGQMKRWYRSGLRHRLLCLLYEPGIRGIWQTFPFMTRKMVEGMLNPILLWVRLWSIYKTSCVEPRFALFFLGWKTHNYVNGILRFFNEYPFAKRYWWAAVLVDRVYLISDWYCWATLGTEAWMSRPKVDNDGVHAESSARFGQEGS